MCKSGSRDMGIALSNAPVAKGGNRHAAAALLGRTALVLVTLLHQIVRADLGTAQARPAPPAAESDLNHLFSEASAGSHTSWPLINVLHGRFLQARRRRMRRCWRLSKRPRIQPSRRAVHLPWPSRVGHSHRQWQCSRTRRCGSSGAAPPRFEPRGTASATFFLDFVRPKKNDNRERAQRCKY